MPGWWNLPAAGRLVDIGIWDMYFVHVIRSTGRNYNYIGLTNNLERRLGEHNEGKNKTTKPYRPFKTRAEAKKREKYSKSGIGRDYIKMIKANN